MYEIFAQLLQKYGVTPYKVSKDTGIAATTLSAWKNGISIPKNDKMKKIADYFGVTVDYLLTGKDDEKPEPQLTTKDEKDIAKTIKKALDQIESEQEGLMFDGLPMDKETRDLIKRSLETAAILAKKINKEKYTPKKYQK